MRNFRLSIFCLSALCLIACGGADLAAETGSETVLDASAQAHPDTRISSGALSGLYKNVGADAPVVLIIPGSGPTDLNGNNPLGVESNVYLQLAAGLAEQGVSTVRVDKRGMFSSEEAGNPNDVTVAIYANDYSDWINTIRSETDADCVYVLGHSEGAVMASAAANINANVCGQVLVSGVGRSFGDVLREQLKAQPGGAFFMKKALANIDRLERGETIPEEDLDIISKSILPPHVQGFLISLMQTNPAEMAKTANTRTLIVHGETDIQTAIDDAEALAEATGGTLVIVPGVNHVLKKAPKNRRKNMKTYKNPNLPISTQVVDAIAVFVKL